MPLTYAIPCRVFLSSASGANSLNITTQLKRLEIANQRIDQSGLIKATGSMELAGAPVGAGIGESLDPRLNPTRWAMGSRLLVEVFDGTNWVTHPRGALRILQNVKPSVNEEDIGLEVGCELAYLDNGQDAQWPTRKYWAAAQGAILEPNGSGGFITGDIDSPRWRINNPTGLLLKDVAKDDLINALGTAFDTPLSLVDSIAGQFNYLRNIEGSPLAQMGAIAYSEGYWLWVDGSRQLRATQLDLTRTPDFVLSVAHDSLAYEVMVGGDRPAQDVEVSAPSTKRSSFKFSSWRASRELTNPEGETETLVVSGDEDNSSITTEKSLKELFPSATTSSALVQDTSTSTENTYNSDGYLIETTENGQALRGVILPNLYAYPDAAATQLFSASRRITDYEIIDGAVRSVRERFYEPGPLVFPALVAEDLVLSRSITKAWDPYKDGWLETTTEIDHKTGQCTSFPRYDANTAPPAPTLQPETEEESEAEEQGEASFDGDVPRRKIKVKLKSPANSSSEVDAIAAREGQILHGRSFPSQWVAPLPAEYLASYAPFSAWQWEEKSGLLARYVADGETFVIESAAATVGAEGLLMGLDIADGGGGFTLAPVARAQFKSRGQVAVSGSGDFASSAGPGDLTSSGLVRASGSGNFVAVSNAVDFPAVTGGVAVSGNAPFEAISPRVRVWRSTDQSIAVNVATYVSFSASIFDVGGWWNPATPDRITFPANGVYQIGASVYFSLSTAPVAASATLMVGNTRVASSRNDNSSGFSGFTLSALVQATAGQVAILELYQFSAAAQTIYTFSQGSPILWAQFISPL